MNRFEQAIMRVFLIPLLGPIYLSIILQKWYDRGLDQLKNVFVWIFEYSGVDMQNADIDWTTLHWGFYGGILIMLLVILPQTPSVALLGWGVVALLWVRMCLYAAQRAVVGMQDEMSDAAQRYLNGDIEDEETLEQELEKELELES